MCSFGPTNPISYPISIVSIYIIIVIIVILLYTNYRNKRFLFFVFISIFNYINLTIFFLSFCPALPFSLICVVISMWFSYL
jgi:hypothetical protein